MLSCFSSAKGFDSCHRPCFAFAVMVCLGRYKTESRGYPGVSLHMPSDKFGDIFRVDYSDHSDCQ